VTDEPVKSKPCPRESKLKQGSESLKASWLRQYFLTGIRAGNLDDAALALEQIEPEDKTYNEVLARTDEAT
jgi:hypothetical protein